MKKILRLLTLMILTALIFNIVACSSSDSGTKTDSEKQEAVSKEVADESEDTDVNESGSSDEEKTYAMVFPIVHPFFEPIGVMAEEYGHEKSWNIITNAPDKSDAQLQIQILENLIAMNVDGIAVGPTDPDALVPVIDQAIDKGIPVICFETDAPDSNKLAYIGTDNYNAGRHMGAVIGEKLNGEGDILILTGLPTQMSLNERIRGIEEYLAEKYPNINVVDTQPSEGDPQKAVTLTENMILSHPDFKAIIGIDATAGPAMISVWKAKGWQNNDEHMIITFDDMPDNLQGLKDGYITSIVAQRQSGWGRDVLDLLDQVVRGEEYEVYIDTGSIEITLDNIDSYTEEPSYVEE